MSSARPPRQRSARAEAGDARRRTLQLLVWASLGVLLVLGGLFVLGRTLGGTPLPASAELDRRWGTYLSEREWGTPREARGSDPWGLNHLLAGREEYRFSDDGIAGITDAENEFRVSWAFWDGARPQVTERLYGNGNPTGEHGEELLERRTFHENTPTHSYSRYGYSYPYTADPAPFAITLESAKADPRALVLRARVRNTTSASATLHVVLKAWLRPGATAELAPDGVVLRGSRSVVGVVGGVPTSAQVSAERQALDANLRSGGLRGAGAGHIGALAYRLEIAAGAEATVTAGLAEMDGSNADDAAARARELRQRADAVIDHRAAEAKALYATDVTEHGDVYRQALMSLLWSESYYRWDGSGWRPEWAGKVDAHDVLLMPDKWEYPWIASWDTAFHAVTASLVDPDMAESQLTFLFSERWQQPDGHLPCAEFVMGDECPPIFAWATWRIYQTGNDRDFLSTIYPGLQRHYRYWQDRMAVEPGLYAGRARDTDGNPFLGMDNLPRIAGSAQADASGWMAFFARDMERIARALGDTAAADGYRRDRDVVAEAVNRRLWDETTGFYYDLGSDGKRFITQRSYTGLVPLIAGIVPPERMPRIVAALRDEAAFLSPAGIRSMAADARMYQPGYGDRGVNSNWRGPVWVPLNYLLVHALAEPAPDLAREIRDRVVRAVEQDWQQTGRFHEYFHGDTGAGLGADAQTGWTALVANLIREAWPRQQ